MSPVDSYIERNMSYDLNGNILSLQRYAGGQVANDFAYSYDGNKLVSLTDEGDEGVASSGSSAGSVYTYEYDSNGNMVYDDPNDLSLTYNHLNLIEKVSRNGAVLANYSYLADGTKLSALDNDGNGLVYAGSLVYRKQNGVMSLESGAFPEGRFIATDSGIETHYHLTDHLGSVRATVQVGLDEDGFVYEQLHEVNNFYPFGMRWQDPNQPVSDNRYRYNAKEEQGFLNLPFIDYGWRHYDAKHGRWFGHDKQSEKYYPVSPYAFCLNNPIRLFDPDGASPYYDLNGQFIRVDNEGFSGLIYIVDLQNNIKPIDKGVELSLEAQSNIYTHVLKQMNDIDFSKLYNGQVSINTSKAINGKRVTYNDADNYARYGFSRTEDGQFKVTVDEGDYKNDFKNVETIQNYLGVHEYEGHGTKKYSGGENRGGTHWKAYEAQSKHPTFKKLPADLKKEITDRIKELLKIENPPLYQQRYGNQ